MYPQVGNVYPIIQSLKKFKNTDKACLLLLYLAIEGKLGGRITKTLCKDLLGGSPTQALKILQQANVLDLTEGRLLEPTYENLAPDETIPEELLPFSWKYGPRFHTTFRSYWKLLAKFAEGKRYTPEEYFELLINEVRKDDWWKKVVTEEMVLRKMELLTTKFGKSIPSKIGGLNDISHIF